MCKRLLVINSLFLNYSLFLHLEGTLQNGGLVQLVRS